MPLLGTRAGGVASVRASPLQGSYKQKVQWLVRIIIVESSYKNPNSLGSYLDVCHELTYY